MKIYIEEMKNYYILLFCIQDKLHKIKRLLIIEEKS